GLPNAGTAKQANLAPFCVRLQKIDYFDARKQYFTFCRKVLELRWIVVDTTAIGFVELLDAVNGVAHDVEYPPFDALTNRHFDGGTCVDHLHSAHQAFRGIHSDGANALLTQVLLYL